MAWSVFTFSLRIALPCPRIFAQNRVLVWSVLAFGIVLSHRASSYFRDIFAQNRAAAWSVVIYSLSQALSQGARSYWFMEPDFSLTRGKGGSFSQGWRRRFSKTIFASFRSGGEDEFGGEDDFRRQNSCRRRYSKTIFGPFRPGGEDEFVGEDDIRRRFSDPFGRGAKTNLLAKTIFEDDFRSRLAGGRRRICWRRRYLKTIFGPFRPGGEDESAGEDDIRRRFSDFFGRGAKTN